MSTSEYIYPLDAPSGEEYRPHHHHPPAKRLLPAVAREPAAGTAPPRSTSATAFHIAAEPDSAPVSGVSQLADRAFARAAPSPLSAAAQPISSAAGCHHHEKRQHPRSGRERRSHRSSSTGATVAVGGLTVGRGVAPQLWTAHPRGPSQNIPIRASKGMICPDLGEIGFGRGRGFSPVVFPTPLLLV